MAVFILTHNPSSSEGPYEDLDIIRSTARGRKVPSAWSVGARRGGIARGDHAFLLRQHRERGIVALGEFSDGEVWPGRHWADPKRTAYYANLRWLQVLSLDDRLDISDVKSRVKGPVWDRMQGSGVLLDDGAGKQLERLWQRHVGAVRTVTVFPDEPSPGTYAPSDVKRVVVNRYERDPIARAACLKRWGRSCCVCDVNFGDIYGPVGEGFIHVHHLHPVSERRSRRSRIDPVKDLRPVCPNCHAMLHHGPRLRTPDELRKLLRKQQDH